MRCVHSLQIHAEGMHLTAVLCRPVAPPYSAPALVLASQPRNPSATHTPAPAPTPASDSCICHSPINLSPSPSPSPPALCPVMRSNEAICISGTERYTTTAGYAFSLRYGGDYRDSAPRVRVTIDGPGAFSNSKAGEYGGSVRSFACLSICPHPPPSPTPLPVPVPPPPPLLTLCAGSVCPGVPPLPLPVFLQHTHMRVIRLHPWAPPSRRGSHCPLPFCFPVDRPLPASRS